MEMAPLGVVESLETPGRGTVARVRHNLSLVQDVPHLPFLAPETIRYGIRLKNQTNNLSFPLVKFALVAVYRSLDLKGPLMLTVLFRSFGNGTLATGTGLR
jgi:hypothetical protein